MGRVGEGEEQADRHRLDARHPQSLHQRDQLGRVQRTQHVAVAVDALVELDPTSTTEDDMRARFEQFFELLEDR